LVARLKAESSVAARLAALSRISGAIDAVDALRDRDLRELPWDQLELACIDADRLAAALDVSTQNPASDRELELAARLSDRILAGIGYLALLSPTSERGAPSSEAVAPDHPDLGRLARDYGADAERENRLVGRFYAASLLVGTVSVALAVAGLVTAADSKTFQFGEFGAFALVALAILAYACALLLQAGRHRMAALEARRLQRQLDGLDPYLSPLPKALRDLLRSTLVSSLFSRLPSEEPWREPQWPETASLIEAIRSDERSAPPGEPSDDGLTQAPSDGG